MIFICFIYQVWYCHMLIIKRKVELACLYRYLCLPFLNHHNHKTQKKIYLLKNSPNLKCYPVHEYLKINAKTLFDSLIITQNYWIIFYSLEHSLFYWSILNLSNLTARYLLDLIRYLLDLKTAIRYFGDFSLNEPSPLKKSKCISFFYVQKKRAIIPILYPNSWFFTIPHQGSF